MSGSDLPTASSDATPRPQPDCRVVTRSAYAKPVLKDFGPVGRLTQAGTGTNAEMGMSMSTMQMA